jgi:UDP:flavonoid glycosyltransferase YjiC (YdhE family)
MAFVPVTADQPLNAQLMAERGAGIALDGPDAVAAELRDAVERLLDDPRHRAAAGALADDIAALAPVAEAVAALEDLALSPVS